MEPKYKRVIIKMSGEALAGNDRFGLNNDVLSSISNQILQAKETGCEICTVVGGGNFWRGRRGHGYGPYHGQTIWACWPQR